MRAISGVEAHVNDLYGFTGSPAMEPVLLEFSASSKSSQQTMAEFCQSIEAIFTGNIYNRNRLNF